MYEQSCICIVCMDTMTVYNVGLQWAMVILGNIDRLFKHMSIQNKQSNKMSKIKNSDNYDQTKICWFYIELFSTSNQTFNPILFYIQYM